VSSAKLLIKTFDKSLLRDVGDIPERCHEGADAGDRGCAAHAVDPLARRGHAVRHLALRKNQQLCILEIDIFEFERGKESILRGLRTAAVSFLKDDSRKAHDARCRIESGDSATGAVGVGLAVFIAAHNTVSDDVEHGGTSQLFYALLGSFTLGKELGARNDLKQATRFGGATLQSVETLGAEGAGERGGFSG